MDNNIKQKIQHLKQSYADFLNKMEELRKEEQAEINKLLKEVDQIKMDKILDKINQLPDNNPNQDQQNYDQ